MNNIVLMGRLTADVELKNTDSGIEYCTFSIAIDRPFSGKDSDKITDFIPCKAWKKTAVFISKYFKKGQMICIDGNMNVDKYVGNDGNNKTFTYVHINRVEFCGGKSESKHQTSQDSQDTDLDIENNDDDLPF